MREIWLRGIWCCCVYAGHGFARESGGVAPVSYGDDHDEKEWKERAGLRFRGANRTCCKSGVGAETTVVVRGTFLTHAALGRSFLPLLASRHTPLNLPDLCCP